MANIRKLSSAPLNAPDTGKPMEYEFDMDVPEEAQAFADTRKKWAEEARQFREASRNVFRLDQNSPGATLLRGQVPINLETMRKEAVPQGGAGAGAMLGGTLAGAGTLALTKNPGAAAWAQRAGSAGGAWLGGALSAPVVGRDPVQTGNEMALTDVAGQGIGKLMQMGGTRLMQSALDPPSWINEHFPGAWRTALRERIGLANPRTLSEGLAETGTPGAERAGLGEQLLGNTTGRTGAAATKIKLDQAEARVQQLLTRAQAVQPARLANGTMGRRGARIDLENDIIPEVRKRLFRNSSISRMPKDRIDAMVEVDNLLQGIVNENPGAVNLVRAHQLKRGAQTEAADLLEQLTKAKANGNLIDNQSELREKVMRELNAVLLERLRKAVPGYYAAEMRLADLMGLERAFKFREAASASGIEARMGGSTMRFNPEGLIPEHLRSTLARNLTGPAQPFVRAAVYPANYLLSPTSQRNAPPPSGPFGTALPDGTR